MSMDQVLGAARSFEGVLELAPSAGSGHPEISWGDHFFYYAPDGTVPQNTQPYATIVTKDYPGDTLSKLDGEGRWRLNIHAGVAKFEELIGETPRSFRPRDFSESDAILPHPVYGELGWVAIVNPGARTMPTALALLRDAHEDARRRAERRAAT
jgi:hypothetical protein